MRDRRDRPRGRLVLLRDVTEKRKVQEQLRQSEERYRAVIEQAAEGIFPCDLQSRRILESNAAFQRLLGYDAAELTAMTLYDLIEHDSKSVDQNIRVVTQQRTAALGERRYKRRDGTLVDLGISSSLISYSGREVLCTVVRDFTSRKALERRLEHRAFHDPLTELPNRVFFTQRLEEDISKGTSVALLFVDLVDFKQINDNLGHECGDALLIGVANRLAGCLRSSDFAPPPRRRRVHGAHRGRFERRGGAGRGAPRRGAAACSVCPRGTNAACQRLHRPRACGGRRPFGG